MSHVKAENGFFGGIGTFAVSSVETAYIILIKD